VRLFVRTAALRITSLWIPSGATHQKGTADDDKDTALLVAGLRVDGRDLVLNALERKLLCSNNRISLLRPLLCHDVSSLLFMILVGVVSLVILSYLQLADDVGGTEERRLLKGEHGVLAL
jgi:hypothetical protein